MLERELELVVRRLRGFTPVRYAAPAAPFPTRADAAYHLAEVLADAEPAVLSVLAVLAVLAAVGAAAGPTRRPALPRLGDMALADQVAVLGHDLVRALRATRAGPGRPASEQAHVVALLLAEVLLHRHDLDGAAPAADAARLVLDVLDPSVPGTPARLLVVAAARCPAYRS